MFQTQPNNTSTTENPVGRFMVAVGAVIELKSSGKILLNRRNPELDWRAGEWEITYGRIDQFEGLEKGLAREIHEETGLRDVEIVSLLSAWHMFRGTEELAENELIGVTYRCRTQSEQVRLSSEHSEYRWVTPQEALDLVSIEGIRRDITKFIKNS